MVVNDKYSLTDYLESNPESHLFPLLAWYHLEDEDVPKAVACCEASIKMHPDSAMAHYMMALAAIKTGNEETAIEYLKLVIELDRGFLQAFYKLIETGKNRLSPELMKCCLERISVLNPFDKTIRERLKSIPDNIGDYQPEPQISESLEDVNTHMGPIEAEPEFSTSSKSHKPESEPVKPAVMELSEMFRKLKSEPLEEVQKETWTIPVLEKKSEPIVDIPELLKPEPVKKPKTPAKKPKKKSLPKKTGINQSKIELKIPIPTLTFVEVLKKQKLYDQALKILDMLETRTKDPEKIASVREEIIRLKKEEESEDNS